MEPPPLIYHTFIDPLLRNVHDRVYNLVPENSQAMDVACGTGALANKLAQKCRHVTGLDIEERMINYARQNKAENTEFIQGDAINLSAFKDKQFDVVTMSLAFHQFHISERALVLSEIRRISKRIIFSDYSIPVPDGLKKTAVHVAERLAGRSHYNNFITYHDEGGLSNIPLISPLRKIYEETSGSGLFRLVVFE